jgi:hypothetical protein
MTFSRLFGNRFLRSGQLVLILSAAFFWGLYQSAEAQLSLSLSGRYQKFIGGEARFPYNEVADFPSMAGLEGRLEIGMSYKLAASIYGAAFLGTREGEFTYANYITTRNSGFEFGGDFRYYLLGAYNQRGGFYTKLGASGGLYRIDWRLKGAYRDGEYLFPEPEYFQDVQFWLVSVNGGIGAEVFLGSFYLFGEGSYSYRIKDYVSDVTIYEPHVHHFWQANLGVRIPLGGSR